MLAEVSAQLFYISRYLTSQCSFAVEGPLVAEAVQEVHHHPLANAVAVDLCLQQVDFDQAIVTVRLKGGGGTDADRRWPS